MKDIRIAYQKHVLRDEDMPEEPLQLFQSWWSHALEANVPEPNAMSLSTINEDGHPTCRIVLMKGADENGFEFYTNYESAKAKHLAAHPFAAIVFHWKETEQQIRIEGSVEKISFEQSQAYFQSRPRGSQVGAWASPQSKVIDHRKWLEDSLDRMNQKFENIDPLPCPPFWGGFVLMPALYEFWQGRDNRLHDRIRYTKDEKGAGWIVERLAP